MIYFNCYYIFIISNAYTKFANCKLYQIVVRFISVYEILYQISEDYIEVWLHAFGAFCNISRIF